VRNPGASGEVRVQVLADAGPRQQGSVHRQSRRQVSAGPCRSTCGQWAQGGSLAPQYQRSVPSLTPLLACARLACCMAQVRGSSPGPENLPAPSAVRSPVAWADTKDDPSTTGTTSTVGTTSIIGKPAGACGHQLGGTHPQRQAGELPRWVAHGQGRGRMPVCVCDDADSSWVAGKCQARYTTVRCRATALLPAHPSACPVQVPIHPLANIHAGKMRPRVSRSSPAKCFLTGVWFTWVRRPGKVAFAQYLEPHNQSESCARNRLPRVEHQG